MQFFWVIAFVAFSLVLNRAVPNYDRVLDTWTGQHEQRLLEEWGDPPDVIEKRGERRVYVYKKRGITHTTTPRGRRRIKRCVTRFFIDATETIVESTYHGRDCMLYFGDKGL